MVFQTLQSFGNRFTRIVKRFCVPLREMSADYLLNDYYSVAKSDT